MYVSFSFLKKLVSKTNAMKTFLINFLVSLILTSCSSDESQKSEPDSANNTPTPTTQEMTTSNDGVQKLITTGNENNYTFTVTLKSPDTGCDQYADWWEVIDLEGNLIYRRILAHSHVNEQPFTRSGGKVAISATTKVIIRAHMNNSGYLPQVLRGTITDGFISEKFDVEKFTSVATTGDLPSGCDF